MSVRDGRERVDLDAEPQQLEVHDAHP